MPVYPTHEHQFVPLNEDGERCMSCGYARWRGVPGSEYAAPEPEGGWG